VNAATMPAPQLAMLLAQSAGGEPVAVIRWNAAMRAPGHGRQPGSPSDTAVPEIAAAIAEPAIAVRGSAPACRTRAGAPPP
jgi:hypothetical protein